MAAIEYIGPIWRRLLGKAPAETSAHFELYCKRVELLLKLPVAIVRCDSKTSLSREELENLLTPFSRENPASTVTFVTRFLAKGLSEGRKTLGWQVAIPPVPLSIKREQSRFTPAGFADLAMLRHIEEDFIASLRRTLVLSHEQHLGRLMLSAILFGGLLHRQWLEPWALAISERKVRAHGTILWVDMERFWQRSRAASDGSDGGRKRNADDSIVMARRWVADPLTRCLIMQWLQLPCVDDGDNWQLPNPYDLVTMFLRGIGLSREAIPRNLKHFLGMAETRLGLVAPPYLVSYATGDIDAVSVPAETWIRLLSGKAVPRQAIDTPDNNAEPPVPVQEPAKVVFHSRMVTPEEQRRLLNQLRKLFSNTRGTGKSIPDLLREIDRFTGEQAARICPSLLLLAKWAKYLLNDRNKPATVERYLGAVAAKMLAIFENEDPLELEVAEFGEYYDRIVETISSTKEQGYARQTLGRFHRFLFQHYGVPEVHAGFFSQRSGPPETTVNANLVGQAEFDRLKRVLGFEDNARCRTATACLLAAIFGFRCGLRRNEVLYLRIRDIMGRHKPELVLRPTSKRGLKSSCASRRIPLHALLQPAEIDLLQGWLGQHRSLGKEALLFGAADRPLAPMPESLLLRPIREALHQVTGDHSLTFHSLRHSFATWLLVRLAGDDCDQQTPAPFQEHPEFERSRTTALRKDILGNEFLGRPAAYAVSSLCGHADLSTTFTSYIHMCDWLLGRTLAEQAAPPKLDIETIMAVTSLSRASVFRSVNESVKRYFSGWPKLFMSMYTKSGIDLNDPLLLTAREPDTGRMEFPAAESLPRLWVIISKALRMHQILKMSLVEIETQLRVPQETLANWFAAARHLANMKVTGEHHSFRHRTVAMHLELVGHDNEGLELWDHKTEAALMDRRRNGKTKQQKQCMPSTEDKISIKQSLHPERFPVEPRLDVEQKLLQRYLTAFELLPSDKQEKVLRFVDYFCGCYCINSGGLWHESASWAKHHLEVLKMLDVPTSNIELVDFMTIGEGVKERSARRKGWEKQLGTTGMAWHSAEQRISMKRFGCGIGVRDVVSVGQTRRASYAFRYAMYILRIGYWEYGMPRSE